MELDVANDAAREEGSVEMRNLLYMLMLSFSIAALGCSDNEYTVMPDEPSIEELEARVLENTYIVRDALEEFRAHNDGVCPIDIYADTNDLGLTLIDLLPEGQLLENPFTGERTEPVDTIATEPGQTGYYRRSMRYPSLYPFLYYLNGFGDNLIIAELSNEEELEWKVITNCLLVREAAERWAELSGGIYPRNVSRSTTPEGYTLIDFLPGGHLLVNPITGAATEPGDYSAASAGEVGYQPVVHNLQDVGYIITGCGAWAGTNIFTWSYYPGYTCLTIYNEIVHCDE